jgi:hypothetical protein
VGTTTVPDYTWISGAMAGVNNLLIHHDPGTRGGMLAAALVLNEEFNQDLHEQDRLWSIVDVYNTYPAAERHRVLNNMLAPNNYKGM